MRAATSQPTAQSTGHSDDDARWMAAAIALSHRARGRTSPNPNVGCIIVADGIVVGRGHTQAGGRPHAEAVALAEAGERARGACAYVTLEPCAHAGRGPPCAGSLVSAGVARVVIAADDPHVAVNGAGYRVLADAGIAVTRGVLAAEAQRAMAGFLTRQRMGRPHVTLKLALSIDGAVAMADGRSRWITGDVARAHAHVERSRHEAILVGRGTLDADAPALDVRLPGLEGYSPRRIVLTHGDAPPGWERLATPQDIARLSGVDHLLVEGGVATAASFLSADLVDRLLVYRAPVLIGGGRTLPDIGLAELAQAHGRWQLVDSAPLGSDRLDVYERVRG